MSVIKLLISFLYVLNALTIPSQFIDRRSVIFSTVFAPSLAPLKDLSSVKTIYNIKQDNSTDYYAYWSAYGLVPPPIEKTITYEELLTIIDNKEIISLQTAVQHDNVIATTVNNHRWSCPVKDKDFPQLLEDIKDKNGNIPVTVLPIDKNKQLLRHFAQSWLGLYFARFLIYEIPVNIKLLKECNSSMTPRQKMLYLLEHQKDIMQVIRNKTKT